MPEKVTAAKNVLDLSSEQREQIDKLANADTKGMRGGSEPRCKDAQRADGSVEPKKMHTVVTSSQHAEPLKAVRSKEVAGYSGSEETAPSNGRNEQVDRREGDQEDI